MFATRLRWLVAVLGLMATQVFAQSVAFTFDDGPHLSDTPRLTAAGRNQALLDALAKHDVKAVTEPPSHMASAPR